MRIFTCDINDMEIQANCDGRVYMKGNEGQAKMPQATKMRLFY